MGNTQPLPEKNSFYQAKEHFADDFPAWTQDGFEIVKLKVDELFTADTEKLKKIGERVVEGLSKDNVLIIQNSPAFHQTVLEAAKEAKIFLSQSQEQKEQYAAEKVDGKRAFYSGYSLVHFDNRDNKRDREWRDVFQIRHHEDEKIPWPTDSFKTATRKLYDNQWSICAQVLHAIALALDISPSSLFQLVGSPDAPDSHKSENTNLSLFHYFDKNMSYKTPQKCMVHKDHGLLTMLPKTDLPGLELLHPVLRQWVPLEQFIDENDVLLYCGEALAEVTNSRVVPATHRVVRLPQKERFSMPFEMKPDNAAVLNNLVCPEKDVEQKPSTFDGLTKRLQWERIMKSVDRADGIQPAEPSKEDQELDFGQAHHDVQLPSISVS